MQKMVQCTIFCTVFGAGRRDYAEPIIADKAVGKAILVRGTSLGRLANSVLAEGLWRTVRDGVARAAWLALAVIAFTGAVFAARDGGAFGVCCAAAESRWVDARVVLSAEPVTGTLLDKVAVGWGHVA